MDFKKLFISAVTAAIISGGYALYCGNDYGHNKGRLEGIAEEKARVSEFFQKKEIQALDEYSACSSKSKYNFQKKACNDKYNAKIAEIKSYADEATAETSR